MTRAVKRVPDLREQIFERLRASIRAGEVSHDDRLTEMTVAKQFDVSRTPAREALALLFQAGMLTQDARGYRLPPFSRKDIDDLFEVRHLIEPYAVRQIAEAATDAELKALERFAKTELRRSGQDMRYVEGNRRVRARLFSLLRNDKVLQLVNLFEDRLAFIRVRTLSDPAIRRISVEGNQRLIAAIAARDADGAEETMRYLLSEAHKAVVALL
jgi:DNA-binding GntR family transcriptional regulator